MALAFFRGFFHKTAYIEHLEGEVAYLRGKLDAVDAHRDHLTAQLVGRSGPVPVIPTTPQPLKARIENLAKPASWAEHLNKQRKEEDDGPRGEGRQAVHQS